MVLWFAIDFLFLDIWLYNGSATAFSRYRIDRIFDVALSWIFFVIVVHIGEEMARCSAVDHVDILAAQRVELAFRLVDMKAQGDCGPSDETHAKQMDKLLKAAESFIEATSERHVPTLLGIDLSAGNKLKLLWFGITQVTVIAGKLVTYHALSGKAA